MGRRLSEPIGKCSPNAIRVLCPETHAQAFQNAAAQDHHGKMSSDSKTALSLLESGDQGLPKLAIDGQSRENVRVEPKVENAGIYGSRRVDLDFAAGREQPFRHLVVLSSACSAQALRRAGHPILEQALQDATDKVRIRGAQEAPQALRLG